MFENDIEMLKKELDSVVIKNALLETEIVNNNRDERIANELMESESDVESSRDELISNFLVFGAGILASITIVILIAPSSLAAVLPMVLLTVSITAGIFVINSLFDYFKAKEYYNDLATDENWKLVEDIDNIKSRSFELEQQVNYLEEMISHYSELIGYLTDYDNMISYLDLIRKSKVDEINKMFDEYLNEKVDYSKVHFNGEISKEAYSKKLTNVEKY